MFRRLLSGYIRVFVTILGPRTTTSLATSRLRQHYVNLVNTKRTLSNTLVHKRRSVRRVATSFTSLVRNTLHTSWPTEALLVSTAAYTITTSVIPSLQRGARPYSTATHSGTSILTAYSSDLYVAMLLGPHRHTTTHTRRVSKSIAAPAYESNAYALQSEFGYEVSTGKTVQQGTTSRKCRQSVEVVLSKNYLIDAFYRVRTQLSTGH